MSKRFFLALSIVFLGLSVLSDADASISGKSDVVSCFPGDVGYYGGYNCYFLGTDGKIHDPTGAVKYEPPSPIDGFAHFWWGNYPNYVTWNESSFFWDNYWYGWPVTYSGKVIWFDPNNSIFNLKNGVLYASNPYPSAELAITGWMYWVENEVKDLAGTIYSADRRIYVYADGTSNICPDSDNIKAYVIPGQGFACQKSNGSFWSNVSGFSVPSGSQLYTGNSYPDNTPYCWTTSDYTLGCSGIGFPSGKWRDIGIVSTSMACGVEFSTNLFKCWDASGTIISTSSGEAGGEPIPPPTPGTGFAKAGMSCVADRYPKIASTSWIDPGFMNWEGTFTQTTYTGKSPYGCTGWLGNDCGDIIYGIGKSTDGVAVDYIKLYNFDAESVIRADSWKPPTVAVWPRSTLIADYHEPQILQIQAVRNGENYSANVYEFSNVANPSSVEPWANYFDDASKKWLPVYASGGLAKIPLSNGQTKLFLSLREFTVPPIGFRMGYSAEYYDQVSCSTPTNPCKMTLVGANWECRGGYANGYYGQCAYDTDGACSPIVSTGGTVSDGVPEEGAVVIKDSNGNVVSVRPKWSAIQDGGGIDANKVFSCPEYKGFLDIFPCAVTIAGNVVELISQSVTGANGNGGIQKIGTDIGSGATATGGVSLTPVNADSENLADYMFRHSWNRATDSELATPFTNWGKFALYGALFVALLGVLTTIAFVNRKG